MKEVVTSTQMKAIDSYTIKEIGIPSMVLMERAALQVVNCIKQHITPKDTVLAVCGVGNNGGDAVAASRILYCEGYPVDILLIGNEEIASEQTKEQLKMARKLGISIFNNININEYTIIIDGLFGIGLNKPVTGIYEETIQAINSSKHLVFAIDIPSGLSADTAKPMNIAIKADYTITFGYNKVGLILYPGCEYAGKVIVADIGFPKAAFEATKSVADRKYFLYNESDKDKLPTRYEYSNKGTYGRVLIIAGSNNMSGACYLSAKAAYRTGAGLVKVMTVEENRIIMQQLLPEALLYTYSSKTFEDLDKIEELISQIHWASAIVIGPGIGISKDSEKLLDVVIKNAKVPLLIDADGLNILAAMNQRLIDHEQDILLHEEILRMLPKETILTPHVKELSRLIHIPVEQIVDHLYEVSNNCTNNNELIFVIKDPRTIITYKDMTYINTSGNNGMATGGSGDVLTGVIGAFLATGLSPWEASKLGVYIHGLAGDKAAEKKGCYGMLASDIIEALPEVLENGKKR